jgi:hypothetical protein
MGYASFRVNSTQVKVTSLPHSSIIIILLYSYSEHFFNTTLSLTHFHPCFSSTFAALLLLLLLLLLLSNP